MNHAQKVANTDGCNAQGGRSATEISVPLPFPYIDDIRYNCDITTHREEVDDISELVACTERVVEEDYCPFREKSYRWATPDVLYSGYAVVVGDAGNSCLIDY